MPRFWALAILVIATCHGRQDVLDPASLENRSIRTLFWWIVASRPQSGCLMVAVLAGVVAHADWRRLGAGPVAEDAVAVGRSRLLALGGMGLAAISALLIGAQWLAIFVFGPCVRAS